MLHVKLKATFPLGLRIAPQKLKGDLILKKLLYQAKSYC